MLVVLVLNTVAALVGIGFALSGILRPAAMSRSEVVTAGERFYAHMYAVRAVPFGLAAAALPWTERGVAVAWVLSAAAAIQLLDAVLGVWRKEAGMTGGGAALTVVHVVAAIAVL
jgi:hypothetical protein